MVPKIYAGAMKAKPFNAIPGTAKIYIRKATDTVELFLIINTLFRSTCV